VSERRVLAVINPATGRRPAEEIAELLRREASARGITLYIEMTRHPGHAVDLVRDHPEVVDTVIAVGGDGTVSDVVTGMAAAPVTIAIIPAGSTNMIAKDLGVPIALPEAIRVALGDSEPVDIDIAVAGETTFIHMAGAGFDAALMRDASRRLKRKIGWLAYLPPAIKHLNYPPFAADIRIDDLEVHLSARIVLLALGSSIALPRFPVGVGIDRTDGILDVCVFNPPSLVATLSTLAWIALGRPGRSRWHHQFRGRHVFLSADRPVPFEVDGDPLGTLPVEVTILDRKVRVLVPSRKTAPSLS
jgi:diacylglycerol kinase (ATP)